MRVPPLAGASFCEQRGVIKAFNASTFGAPSGKTTGASAATWPGLGLSASSSLGSAASAVAAVASPVVVGGGAGAAGAGVGASASADAGDRRKGGSGTSAGAARDSVYEMAGRLSAWPSEKIEKAKRLKDQLLSKI